MRSNKFQKFLFFVSIIGIFLFSCPSLSLAAPPVVKGIYLKSLTKNKSTQVWVKIYDSDGNLDLNRVYYYIYSNKTWKILGKKVTKCYDFSPYFHCFFTLTPDCGWGNDAWVIVRPFDKANEWSYDGKLVPVSISSEVCDGKDNDCDGKIDEGLVADCMIGSCPGKKVCRSGRWSFCQKIDPCCGISCPTCKYCSKGKCVPKPDGTRCGEGKVCKNGECVWEGKDECQRGTFSCRGSMIMKCRDCDADPFVEWCPYINCSKYTGWRYEGKRWVKKNACQEKEQRRLVYRVYRCWAWRYYRGCWSYIASQVWKDTGRVRNKPDGTRCGKEKECRQGKCVALEEMKIGEFKVSPLKPSEGFAKFKMKYQGPKKLIYYQFQIWDHPDFTGEKLYDSGKIPAKVPPQKYFSFVLEQLPPSKTGKYYARIKLWDAWKRESKWINLGELRELRVY